MWADSCRCRAVWTTRREDANSHEARPGFSMVVGVDSVVVPGAEEGRSEPNRGGFMLVTFFPSIERKRYAADSPRAGGLKIPNGT